MDLLDQVKLENLDEEQKALAELIGLEGLKNLVRAYNGTSIYVPKIESLEKTVRDEYIKAEFDGGNYRELALKYGLTETWIRNIVLEKAKEILKKHTTEDHLFTHAQSVSAAMGAMADYFHEDRDHWEAIGYLHDVDYEEYPEEHLSLIHI